MSGVAYQPRSGDSQQPGTYARVVFSTPKDNAVKSFDAAWLASSRFSLREKKSFRGAKGDDGAITQFEIP